MPGASLRASCSWLPDHRASVFCPDPPHPPAEPQQSTKDRPRHRDRGRGSPKPGVTHPGWHSLRCDGAVLLVQDPLLQAELDTVKGGQRGLAAGIIADLTDLEGGVQGAGGRVELVVTAALGGTSGTRPLVTSAVLPSGTGEAEGARTAAVGQGPPRLCTALGVSASLPLLRWRFTCDQVPRGDPGGEALRVSDDLLRFLMGLTSGASCCGLSGAALVTAASATATSAKGAEKRQSPPCLRFPGTPNPRAPPPQLSKTDSSRWPAGLSIRLCWTQRKTQQRESCPTASLKAPGCSQGRGPTAAPSPSPESRVCRAHGFSRLRAPAVRMRRKSSALGRRRLAAARLQPG